MSFSAALLSFAPIFSPTLAQPDKALVKDTLTAKYFPMKVGDKWIYAWEKKQVTFEVLRAEMSKDTTVFVVRRTIDGKSVEFKLALEEDGVYIHSEGKREFSPPLRQFAFFPRTGDVWKWRGTFGGKLRKLHFENLGVDKITVPAGTFTTISIYQTEESDGFATFWLAPGIGVVQLSGKVEVLGDGLVEFEWKLVRHERK
jgi:hypothetical protein